MNILNHTIDLATAIKAVAIAAGVGGGVYVANERIEQKADKTEVAVLVERQTQVAERIEGKLDAIERRAERIEDKLDRKADKP